MSYLDYYRQNPAWATNQWQSLAPPMPSFQPQPSWGGYDYFKQSIGGMNVDTGLYNYGMNSLRANSSVATYGTSITEAKMQHRRAYGGLGDILVMAPQEIGAAAAYEVWRNWRYHNGILAQPLAGDVVRQREALVGLAIGECAKLWQYTRRLGDAGGQAAAAETAAIAAARIFDQGNDSLIRSGGAYGSLGSSTLSAGALSPVLSPTGSYGYGAMPGLAASSPAYDPMGASLAAPPIGRRRSASFGAMTPYAEPPPLAGSAYETGMYGGADGMLGAGAGYGRSLSRPVSPVYPTRPLSSAGYGAGSGLSYAGSAIDDPVSDLGAAMERRRNEHELHRLERQAQREELSALRGSRYGPDGLAYDGGMGGMDRDYLGYGDEYGARRGYDDIDGYGYGRRRHHGIGRRALDAGLEASRYAMEGGRAGDPYGRGGYY